jgi:hypothetical protein
VPIVEHRKAADEQARKAGCTTLADIAETGAATAGIETGAIG